MRSTEAQREIWTAVQLGPEASCAFNLTLAITLRGPLDLSDLRGALDDVVARHDALRATVTSNGERLHVAAALQLELPMLDLSRADERDRSSACENAVNDEVTRPFDLERGPLARARLVRLRDEEHVLLLTVHHIVCDGWSVDVLLRALADCYSARRRGSTAGLEPAFRFSDFAVAKEQELGGAAYAAAEEFWRSRFRESIPVLDLPVSRARPPIRTFRAGREDRVLPLSLVTSARRVGASAGCSLFATLLAAWEVYICRVSGQQDVVTGIPVAEQAILGLDSLVGHCVSLLPVRSRVSADDRFIDRLRAARAAVSDALEHRACTFGTLIRTLRLPRDASRIPLVPIVLSIERVRTKLQFAGLESEYRWTPRRFVTFELHLNAIETATGLVLECSYNADLFDASMMRHRLEEFETLLARLVANPQSAVSSIPIVTETGRHDDTQARAVPLSPNGGVDSEPLPVPREDPRVADDAFLPPRTAFEALIAEVWQEALGEERVGVYDNFFDLGGHSLLAMAVIARIKERTGHRLSLIDLAQGTLAQLAAACEQRGSGALAGRPTSLFERATQAVSRPWTRPSE